MDVPTDAAIIDQATAVPLSGRRFVLSVLNQRRWQTFKAHKRGYWSLWIFLILFVLSLFAEFIANDKPLIVKYEGQYYFPVFKSYPETAFGGIFETEAVYRDPAVKEMIADKNGWILWPPIPFSYDTPNKNPPMAFPVKPTWMLTKEDCEAAIKGGFHPCNDELEWNWLGTDDQGRDVIARVIYGFRISVLFGLVLTFFASIIGVAAGAVQGYFGGWTDLLFQRFIEIWTSVPQLYLLIIIAAVIEPSFWILLGILLAFSWVALVGVVRAEFLRARNFEYVTAARARAVQSQDHLQASPAERHGGDAHLHALHLERLDQHAHLARFPRRRPARRLALARRAARARKRQSAGAVARAYRLLRHRHHAQPPDLHRRGGARRA
jgi:microcin C transport system permease protein